MNINIHNATKIMVKTENGSNNGTPYHFKEIKITHRPNGMPEDRVTNTTICIFSDTEIGIEKEEKENESNIDTQ